MKKQDRIAAINERHWEWAVKKAAGCTVPWLDLDPALLRRYASGDLEPIPEQLDEIYPSNILAEIEGKDVLCLASGGGQQSAIFSLLGARVTVLDLTGGQLEGDRKAAAYYGYEITAIRGDMRDISCLADESFDFVYQGNSMAWIPDVRQVYSGVVRVLRAGGLYRVDFTNPATEFVGWTSWDGEGYRITVPYAERVEQPFCKRSGGLHSISALYVRHFQRTYNSRTLNSTSPGFAALLQAECAGPARKVDPLVDVCGRLRYCSREGVESFLTKKSS